jgi:hypothetical protein
MKLKATGAAFSLLVACLAFASPVSGNAAEPSLIPYEPCEIIDKAPCIESFVLIDIDGKRTRAIPDGPITPFTYQFAGQSSTPTTTYQWRAPGITHENMTELITLHVYHFPYGAPYCWTATDCTTTVDETVIYSFASGWGSPAPTVDFLNKDNDLLCGTAEKPEKCIRMWGLNPDYRYEVTLRPLPSFDLSYANGEAKNGMARNGFNAKGEPTLIFSGEPVDFSYNIVNSVKPVDPNQTRADVTYKYIGVYIQTTKSGNSDWLAKCNYGREMSLWYSGQLQSYPMWNSIESSLSIKVSSTHYKADNSLNEGVFNIDMPIETARCLWGVDLSKAVSANISVAYPELGISEVVTTSSKVDGKFFRVSAAGFHFSAPTIKMKLLQENVSLPKVLPVLKKATITCIKGKISKKVTAVNPKCPAGYKKK